VRHEDVHGVSGTGIVAEGIEFSSGHVVMEWLSGHSSIAVYQSMRDVVHIHTHGGKTTIEWQDT
jgi:hypothetical protein